MMVGHCHSHPSNHHSHHHHHHRHHPHRSMTSRSGSESSRDESEQYSISSNSSGSGNSGGMGAGGNINPISSSSSSDYSLAMSSDLGERTLHRHPSTASLIDSIERRTQRTYRYGIGLVCVGATLNWLGFAQGTTYIDPLRYLGVACVLTGSFCVCLAMCRWLSKPISVSGHHVSNLEEERSNGEVHVINVSVPMYVPTLHEEYRPTKPPDYEQICSGDEAFPPPYDEAVKLRPSEFFGAPAPSHQGAPTGDTVATNNLYASHFAQSPPPPFQQQQQLQQSSASHCFNVLHHAPVHHQDLSRALLLDHQDNDSLLGSSTTPPTPAPRQLHPHQFLRSVVEGEDPPPAYEPSPRPSISSCSSSVPLIPNSASRFDLPPSFSVRHLFGGILPSTTTTTPGDSPVRRIEHSNNSSSINSNCPSSGNIILNEHLHEQVINNEVDATLSLLVQQQQPQQHSYMPSLQLGNNNMNGNSDRNHRDNNINISGNHV